MINRKLLNELAERYNLGVSYTESGNGGFVTDSSRQVKQSIVDEVVSEFETCSFISQPIFEEEINYSTTSTELIAA